MKRIKIIILLFSPIFLISLVCISGFMALSNQEQSWNNLNLKNTTPNEVLKTSAIPNLLNKWLVDNYPHKVDISADGNYFVTGEHDFCNVTLFNSTDRIWFNDTGVPISSVAISADSQYIVSGDYGYNVSLFNQTGFLDSYKLTSTVYAIAISQNGSYFVAGDNDGNVTLFNSTSDIINFMWSYDTGTRVNSVDISIDGQYIAAGNNDDNVTLFYQNGTVIWELNPGIGDVQSVSMSADGCYIVSGQSSTGNNITLFNRTHGYLWNYSADAGIRSVAISQDGQYIVAGGYDENVILFKQDGTKLWDYYTGNTVWDVAISADGQHIIAGDANYNVTLFNRNGFMWNYTTKGHVEDVSISSDGQYIAVVSGDNYVYLFYNDIYPDSNILGLINTLTTESLNISWFLQDIVGPGKYKVWANDTNGNYYVWRDWTDWANNSDLQVEINRTATGIFNYTIEYNNSRGYFGIPNTVIVNITKPSPSQLNLTPLLLGMQQTGNQSIIILSIIGIGIAVAVVIFIFIIKREGK